MQGLRREKEKVHMRKIIKKHVCDKIMGHQLYATMTMDDMKKPQQTSS